MFVTSEGSPYSRFRRALTTGNLLLVRAAAAELLRVDLPDALRICLLIRRGDPDRYEQPRSNGSDASASNIPASGSTTSPKGSLPSARFPPRQPQHSTPCGHSAHDAT